MKTEIVKLREQQAKIVADARERLEQITDDTEESRVKELEEQFDKAMADHDALDEKIQRMEKLDSAEERLNAGDPRRPGGNGEARGEDTPEAPSYRDVFTKAVAYGVSALSAQERQVLDDQRAALPEELRAQTSTTDASGGYTVPTEFSGEIDKAMALWGPLWDADIVREIGTSNGRRIEWPTVDDTSNTGRIKAENASVDDSVRSCSTPTCTTPAWSGCPSSCFRTRRSISKR